MEFRFESAARDVVRVTDGSDIRFIPASTDNAEYRLLCDGRPADPVSGLPAIEPVIILEPLSEEE
ncbi:hypothetical protein HXX25_03445 [Hyphobacterium sp. CCMP332]|jgi:hypothetical protein|uniref:hypothetical protein n=1 Tax=Hyphobacterium sp. CCMP332 TaxID=2749086 RepID=UPI0016506C95|nr:hypothetical protein [Hyphobacterium sp. CCMP332]QNL18473.1 hypothetical protein HXX25_03445 [Hyphobacterium sp. CCMP332]